MAEFLAEHNCVYGESFIYIQIIFPVDCLDLFIHLIGIFRYKLFDRFQDADSGPQAEIRLVHHLLVAAE